MTYEKEPLYFRRLCFSNSLLRRSAKAFGVHQDGRSLEHIRVPLFDIFGSLAVFLG